MAGFFALAAAFTVPLGAWAQQETDWERYIDGLGLVEDMDDSEAETAYEMLGELAVSRMNINAISREDLERLPFLTAQQIEDICAYAYSHAPIRSAGELAMIPSLDAKRRKLLLQFLSFGPKPGRRLLPPIDSVFKYGQSELVGMFNAPLYTRRGYREGYAGPKYKHWLRYTFRYGSRLKAGLTASQDPGEPFFAGRNRLGYDYYSFYFQLKDMGRLRSLVLGRYRLRLGQGLIMNNLGLFGKLYAIGSLSRGGTWMYGHSSRAEADYLQGGAATVRVARGLDLTAFVSWRKIDATLNKDSASIATLLKSGYHRTRSEIDRQRNAAMFVAGGNAHYSRGGFHVGMSGYFASLSLPLQPDNGQLYRRYYPQGSRFWNASVDYGYTSGRFSFSGETATGSTKAVATLNAASYRLSGALTLIALQRFYSYKYRALFGRSFSEGGQVNNESGVYVGAEWHPSAAWSVLAYVDAAHFPWARYGVSASSNAWDNLVEVTGKVGKVALSGRYRLKYRQKDNADGTALVGQTLHRGRLNMKLGVGDWSFNTQGDVAYSSSAADSFGWMLTESVIYSWPWGKAAAVAGYFDTDSYDSRIYSYRGWLLYTWTFPSFSGRGMRWALSLKADAGRHVTFLARVRGLKYFDRSVISSGLQAIDGSSATELELQMRLRW